MKKSIFIHLFLILISITCIFPLLWMISSSFKTQDTIFKNMSLIPKTFHYENYIIAITEGKFGIAFLNSLLYTVTVIAGVVFFSSLAAYAFSKLKFPGKTILFYMFLAYMMIPIPGIFVAVYVLLHNLGQLSIKLFGYPIIGINTRLGFILPQIAINLSFAIYLLKTFFDQIPKELEDAAKIDGCDTFRTYWNVALPLSKSALGVIIIFNSLSIWNEYLFASIIFNDVKYMPLPVALMKFQGSVVTQYPVLMAGMTITVLPIIIIYLTMQRYIIKGITAGAVKG